MNPAVRYSSPVCPSQDRNLDKMVAQLPSAGIDVKVDPQSYPNGCVARLHDPEGNPIELWQSKTWCSKLGAASAGRLPDHAQFESYSGSEVRFVGSDVSMKIGCAYIFADAFCTVAGAFPSRRIPFRLFYGETLGERTDGALQTDHPRQESAPGPMATTK